MCALLLLLLLLLLLVEVSARPKPDPHPTTTTHHTKRHSAAYNRTHGNARSVNAINRRFQEAAIGDDVARAGVLVHMPITYALSPGMPWEPAPGTGPGRSTVSCTLLNRDAGSTKIYEGADALCYGWVVSTTASAVLCSYHADGCTNVKACAAPPSAQDGCGQLRGLSPAIHSADGVCRDACGPQWCDDLAPQLSVAPNLCAHTDHSATCCGPSRGADGAARPTMR